MSNIMNSLIAFLCLMVIFQNGKQIFVDKVVNVWNTIFLLLNVFIFAICVRDIALGNAFIFSKPAGIILATVSAIGLFANKDKDSQLFWGIATIVGVLDIVFG